MRRSIKIITVITALFVLYAGNNLFAIGNFSLGINTGGTYDPNYLGNEINSINKEMEYNATGGASCSQIDVPYSIVAGINIRYQFNYLLFRFGGYFTKPYGGTKGRFTSALGVRNDIEISTYQAAFPLSVAFMFPIKNKAGFYLGGGMTYYIASVKITQSNPAAGPDATAYMRDSYSATFPGWHIIVGAEVPLFEKYSITAEWMHQEGRSYPAANDGLDSAGTPVKTPKRVINARGDFILIGINYYISI